MKLAKAPRKASRKGRTVEGTYEVDSIIGRKKQNGGVYYLVKWKGCASYWLLTIAQHALHIEIHIQRY
jgi:Chromo (CHRromatin Organisation MOdifier) domain